MDIAYKTCLILHQLAAWPKLISLWHKKHIVQMQSSPVRIKTSTNHTTPTFLVGFMLISTGCSYQSQELKFHINNEFNSP